jgi:hypothetical protein
LSFSFFAALESHPDAIRRILSDCRGWSVALGLPVVVVDGLYRLTLGKVGPWLKTSLFAPLF